MKKLTVITPVYCNARSLEKQFELVREQRYILLEKGIDLDICYVNDGSQDNSLQVLLQINKTSPDWVTVIDLTRNFGSMNAIKCGLSRARGDCVVYLAADLQDPPELISKMADKWLLGEKYIIAVRNKREDPLLSKLFSRLYYFFVRKFLSKTYPKGGFDVFLFDRQYTDLIVKSGQRVNILFFSYVAFGKPYMLSYDRQARDSGTSGWTFKKKLMLMYDSILSFSSLPLRLSSFAGVFVSILSFLYGAFVLIYHLIQGGAVPGYASIVCLVSFLMAVVVFMLSIIGSYIIRIYGQISNNPDFVVKDTY